MPTSTRVLLWFTWLLLIGGLSLPAWAQQVSPQLWDPARTDPQYEARKQQAVRPSAQLSGQARAQATTVPRPTCFEPFDTTATGGWTQVPRGDDTSYGPVSLGWDFSLYGTRYGSVYINTNGNITFDAPLTSFNAAGFPISTPMIAPFWADVDTRNLASGTVWFKVFPDRLVVVWNRVGYFGQQADKKNTFQLVIRANTAPTFSGNDVLLSYDDMQWTTGSASQGSNGFGGVPATVGTNRGNSVNYTLTGRFNLNSSQAPNQPNVGDPGGINWLDGQCLGYQVRGTGGSSNIPPAVAGLPADGAITVAQGETRTVSLQFSGPETNQTVTVTSNLNGLCNATASPTGNGGTNPTVVFTVTGSPCNVGTTTVNFTATDNGVPTAAQTTFPLQVTVNPPLANGIWTGAVSTDWATPDNWSNNVLPTSSLNVTIPASAPRMPVLSGAGTAASLTAASGAALTLASSGALTLSGNLTNNGATLTLTGSATLAVTGTLANTRGTLELSSGSPTVWVGGNLVNAATATLTAGTVVLNGTAEQTLTNSGTLTFGTNATLQLNNPAGARLGSPLAINSLDLISGLLATDATNLLTLAPTGTVSGGSSSSYVNGPMARPIPVTGNSSGVYTSYVFPLGKVGNYRPLTLRVNAQATALTYRAEQVEGDPGQFGTVPTATDGTTLTRVSAVRSFTLVPVDGSGAVTQPTGFQGRITLSFGLDDRVTNATALQIAKRANATQPWTNTGLTGGSINGTSGGYQTGYVTSNTFSSFSDFALASINPSRTANPLPVKLVSFTATAQGSASVRVAWTTASELNSARFEVERSADGTRFERLGQVAAAGTSTAARTYAYTDAQPLPGLAYYRLRQVDTDGTATLSPVRVVTIGLGVPAVTLHLVPNPARDRVQVRGAVSSVDVLDLTGRLLRTQPAGEQWLSLTGLQPGVYLVRSGQYTTQLQVQ